MINIVKSFFLFLFQFVQGKGKRNNKRGRAESDVTPTSFEKSHSNRLWQFTLVKLGKNNIWKRSADPECFQLNFSSLSQWNIIFCSLRVAKHLSTQSLILSLFPFSILSFKVKRKKNNKSSEKCLFSLYNHCREHVEGFVCCLESQDSFFIRQPAPRILSCQNIN